jgi:dTDP-4-dehydrorhamnose reductase/dTDP-4-dehydrorhamnose 3,5-epimerase
VVREPTVAETPIPGVLLLTLPVHGDNRGWFKENWQREKMVALGLPDFHPVQNNISFNDDVGVTRGIHAEPWDKFISVASGRIFGAWVDLREGPTLGTVFTTEIGPEQAIYVPRGVGNAYQTLEPNTVYTYLVNDHWRPDASYTFLNLADETVAIDWPIALDSVEISEKDLGHPRLADVEPVPPRRTLILGSDGQLGRAMRALLPEAVAWSRDDFDVGSPEAWSAVDWSGFDTIINAAAYTDVDQAETREGRRAAWLVNVHAVVHMARTAIAHNLTVVQVSSDYVFDGERESHPVDETFAPLGVYGQTKAAGDAVVMTVPKHYIVRTSWVVGEGSNFIRTMQSLADKGVNPRVVNDQIGLLTYATDLAQGIVDLLQSDAAYGTYNITSGGAPRSWFEIAQQVFADAGHDPARVTPVSTAEYFADATEKLIAPRPRYSTLE